MKAAHKLAGHRAGCPKCKQPVTVPVPDDWSVGKAERLEREIVDGILPEIEEPAAAAATNPPAIERAQFESQMELEQGAAWGATRRTTVVLADQTQGIPALASFFMPGLGQLIQGRNGAAAGWWLAFAASVLSMFVVIGFVLAPIVVVLCIVDAAKWRPTVTRDL